MKKMIMMLSIALVALTSCGTGTEGEAPKTDSTAVVVDTLVVDSTAVVTSTETVVDTTKK
jgi:hypothetical protein